MTIRCPGAGQDFVPLGDMWAAGGHFEVIRYSGIATTMEGVMSESAVKLLHLDDDALYLEQFSAALRRAGIGAKFEISQASDADEYFTLLERLEPDVVVLDVNLGGHLKGPEIAVETRRRHPGAVILMCSDHKGLAVVSACLGGGADDFVFKGSDDRELALRILGTLKLKRSSLQLRDAGIPAVGRTMKAVRERLARIVQSAVTSVHVCGESGTGKELVVDLLAQLLPAGTPLIRVNCGAIAPTLMESELFGHVRGAFTGAQADKSGLIEAASGGWLFLDEVATLPSPAQVALLRVLESHVVRRVGDNRERPVRIRIVSATNEALTDLVREGRFRQDLWQRLQEATIDLPPLRERTDELPDLIRHFCKVMQGGPYQIPETVIGILSGHDWRDGNIRELRNTLRAMTELAVEGMLTPLSIPRAFWEKVEEGGTGSVVAEAGALPGHEAFAASSVTLEWEGHDPPSYAELCDALLLELLRREYGMHGKLGLRTFSRSTGIPRSTLSTRLRALVDQRQVTLGDLSRMINVNRS